MFSDCLLLDFLYPELFFMPQQTHSHSSAAFCPHSSWNSSSSFYFHSSHPRSSLSLTWKTLCFQGLSSPWCSVSGCLQCPALAAHSYPSLALKRPLRASMWSEVASALEASTQVLKHSFSWGRVQRQEILIKNAAFFPVFLLHECSIDHLCKCW